MNVVELVEVIKKEVISNNVMIDKIIFNGIWLNILNNCVLGDILKRFEFFLLVLMFNMLKILNYIKLISVGINKIFEINFFIECFLDICVMNILMNGF